MARVKRGVVARRRHKKIIRQAKGYYNARRKVFRVAKQAVTKALQYAYIGRKLKKRQFRSLWIARINAASRMFGLSYSRFIAGLNKAGITLDRKVLADIAVHDLAAFGTLAEAAGKALNIEVKKPETLPRYVVEPRPAKGKAAKSAQKAAAAPSASKGQRGSKSANAGKDDLTRVQGIDSTVQQLLHEAGIETFGDLAGTSAEALRSLLGAAGSQYASLDPATWPEQAELAAAGNTDALKALQSKSQGGDEAE